MSEDIRTKLSGEILRHAAWEDVHPHIIRGVVFLALNVPLVDVGIALAIDDRPMIESLIEANQLRRPMPEDLTRWADKKTRFAALIVSPFVLIQEEAEITN